MAALAAASASSCLPFSARYVKEVQTDTGVCWKTKVSVASGGIKKCKTYSLGRYSTQAEAIFAVEKFLDDAATFAKQSRQLKAGKNARSVMLLKCRNLSLRMQVKSLEGELAFQSKASAAALAAAKEEGSAAFDLAMETAGEEQEEDAARLAACEEEIARQKQEIADLKLDQESMRTAVKTAQASAATAVWGEGMSGGVVQGVTGRTAIREARRKAAEEGRHWAAASFDIILENHDDAFRPDEIAEHGDALEKARQERGKKMKAVTAAKEGKKDVCVRCENARGALDSAGHCVLCVAVIKIENTIPFTFNDEW